MASDINKFAAYRLHFHASGTETTNGSCNKKRALFTSERRGTFWL